MVATTSPKKQSDEASNPLVGLRPFGAGRPSRQAKKMLPSGVTQSLQSDLRLVVRARAKEGLCMVSGTYKITCEHARCRDFRNGAAIAALPAGIRRGSCVEWAGVAWRVTDILSGEVLELRQWPSLPWWLPVGTVRHIPHTEVSA